jgi:hypothetical protein
MPRRFYISCDYSEQALEPVQALHQYLEEAKCIVEYPPQPHCYRLIEEAIERCDVFVVALGTGYRCSTWLAHEAFYACILNKYRMSARPRLLGMRLDENEQLLHFLYDGLSGWITGPETYPLLFEDLPPKH